MRAPGRATAMARDPPFTAALRGCAAPHGRPVLDLSPHLEQAADAMLDDLIWWATTLRAGRASGSI
jgi:hypothetical protein